MWANKYFLSHLCLDILSAYRQVQSKLQIPIHIDLNSLLELSYAHDLQPVLSHY